MRVAFASGRSEMFLVKTISAPSRRALSFHMACLQAAFAVETVYSKAQPGREGGVYIWRGPRSEKILRKRFRRRSSGTLRQMERYWRRRVSGWRRSMKRSLASPPLSIWKQYYKKPCNAQDNTWILRDFYGSDGSKMKDA